MAGKINKVCNEIITKVSGGNPTLVNVTRTKLILKGVNPDRYDEKSDDDSAVLEKLKGIANEFKLNIIF
ncbi:MAG: hypothetical protein PVH88_07565 [Ignavibacteria bacterium]|jgi:hypothetical protein